MFNSLKSRLWFSNMMLIAFTIVLIIIFINIFAVYEFNAFKLKDLEKTYNDIYEIVLEQYNNEWDIWILEEVGIDILENKKVIISLYDENSKILYDSIEAQTSSLNPNSYSNHHNHMGKGHMMQNNDASNNNVIQPIKRYNEKKYEIFSNETKIGMLFLSSTEHYDNNELNYLKKITQIICTIGVVAMGITIIASSILSNKISKPISNITRIAGDISNGNYGKTVNDITKISELQNLILAINNLSGNLERYETLRKRLTQDIAHELRTPISTMQGNLEAVLDGVWEMDNEKINLFYDEVQRLSRLVADLNNLSKYENSVLNKTSFNMKELFQYVLSTFDAVLNEKKIQININTERIIIYADKDKLTQMIMNLMSNAVKFTSEYGSISINAVKSDDEKNINISICDTGVGISEEDIPYVFERFYRADKSRSRKYGGAGIGLSVVKVIVEAHGGNIYVNSVLEKGTVFTINLPNAP